MTRVRAAAFLSLTLAAPAALAASLPFTDGFEPPEVAFANWSTTRQNGGNALTQSTAQAWDETAALAFTYAGVGSAVQAAAIVDFAAVTTTPFVRFWLKVPTGTGAAMGSGSTLRLVRLGDAVTGAAGTGGAAKVNLLLRKDLTGPLYLRLDYVNNIGNVIPLGTVLATPITEGTWHYVELGYQPASPRVRVFIDDPVNARVDAAPGDLVAHNLLTAWVGLADAADPQGGPITLFMDDVVVGTAPVGTAQATAQHFNELESGTLSVINTPPGKASSTFTTGGTTVSVLAAAAAAHRGAFGLRVTDADAQVGPGGGAGQTTRITGTGGIIHRRFFWRPTSTNGLGSRTLAAVSSSGLGGSALAEVVVAGNGALALGGNDAALAYVTTPSATVASTNVWHLVELLVSGVGTASGTRKLYLDGTLAAQQAGVNWTGVFVDLLVDGQVFSNSRAFQGLDDFDDLRVSRTVMPSRLVLTPPAMTDQACSGPVVVVSADSDGTPRGAVEPTVVGLFVAGVTGSFYSDPGCTSAIASAPLAVGTTQLTVYFKPTTAGTATLSATNVDYLTSPGTVLVASLATRLAFAGAGQTVAAGACSAAAQAQAQTSGGTPATVDAATAVGLSSASTTLGFFSNPACTVAITSVTILEGQSTAGFYFKDTSVGLPGISLTATGLTSGAQAQNIIAAAPSKLVVVTPARTVVAGLCSAVLTFQAQDTYGNPATVAAQTPVTFSSTSTGASFFTDAACSTASGTANIPAAGSTVSIYFEDTRAGSPTVTAAAAGFLNGTQVETVTAAAPAGLAFTSAPQTVTAGACSSATVVQAQDAFGNPSPVPSGISIALSSLPATVTFYSGVGCVGAVGSVSLGAGSSDQTFYFIGSAAGPVSFTAASTPLTPANQSESISASGPTKLVFISAPQSVAAGNCSAAALVQAQDSFGNAAAVASNTTVTMTTTSGSLRFSPTGACASSVGTVTIGAGLDSVAVYFKDTVAGPVTLTATASGMAPGSQNETIRSAPPSQLAFSTPPQTGVAGACLGPLTGQSRDGFGNPATVLSATPLALSTTSTAGVFHSNAGCSAPIAQATIAAGTNQVSFYYRDTRVGAPTLTASNPGLSAPTQGATIGPAPPAKLSFVSAPQTVTAGNCAAQATVEVRDAFDNPSPVVAATSVDLLSSSATTEFHLDAACSATATSVGIPLGGTLVRFYFLDPKAGTPTLTARSAGLTDGTQVATVNRGPAAKLAFLTPPRSPVAGTCSPALTVQAQDATGNDVAFAAATAIALSTSSATGALYSDSGCTTVVTQVTVPAGSSAGTFYFKDTLTGPWGVTATAPALAVAAQTVTVVAGPATVLVVETPPQTLVAGTCSAAVVVDVEDALGNLVPAPAVRPVGLSSTAASTGFFLASDCSGAAVGSVDLPPGGSTVTFYFRDPKAGAPTLTFSLAGVPPALQVATLVPGAPSQVAFTTPAQTVSVGTCSALAKVEVQDSLGNPSALAGPATLSLSSSSTTATFYSDQTCTTAVTSLALAVGVTGASFYFLDTSVGTTTLTVSSAPLAAAVQQGNIVTPGAPAALVFATAPLTLEASACSDLIIVELKDASGNSAPALAPVTVTLAGATPGVSFHADGTCGAALTTVTVPVGAYRALFHFRDPVVHASTLTASAPGLQGVSQVETTICPAAVDGAACDDADLCNGRETCRGGSCASNTPVPCDDADPCTTNTCVSATGCNFPVIATCCRAPVIAVPNLNAAVGVPWHVGPAGQLQLVKGTGPLRWAACDSPPAGLTVDATTGTVNWVPTVAGPQPICVKTTGACGEDTSRFTVQVQAVPPVAPVAAFTVIPAALALGATAQGDAQASTGVAPLSYEWSWGVGSPLSFGPTVSHAWATAGSHTVRLEVFDAVGQRAQASQGVTVSGAGCATPPPAVIVADKVAGDGSLDVNFGCDCAAAPAGAVYRWDFSDGSSAYGAQVQHTFGPGAYQVRLAVSAGGCTSEDAVVVRVGQGGRAPPECALSVDPAGGPAPLSVAFAARFSSAAGRVVSAAWSFSDGLSADATAHGGQVGRTLDVPGTLGAQLLVTDEVGLSCHASAEVTATSLTGVTPPRIVSVPNAGGRCGEAWVYDDDAFPTATGSGPLTWALGKNASGTGQPRGMTVDAATGELLWTPDSKTRGPTRVTLVAQNEAGAVEQDFLVEVECAPQGCGCGSGGLGSGALALLALVGAAGGRRRRVRLQKPGRSELK